MRRFIRLFFHRTKVISPLRTKIIQSGMFVLGILFSALLLCLFILLYNTSHTAQILNTNHLHSTALRQLDTLLDCADAFCEQPDAETRKQLDLAFSETDQLFQQFSDAEMPGEQQALAHSILQTYRSYRDALILLYDFPKEQYGSQDFFIQFYAAQNIGKYIDAYLKQLIQQSLQDECDSYDTQLHMIRRGPILIAVLILLSAFLLYRFAFWLYQRLVFPIFRISEAAECLVAKEMDFPDLPVVHEDEIGALTRNFNQMKNDCRQLIIAKNERDALTKHLLEEHIRRTEAEKQHADAEKRLSAARFDALRNQVNPHFLFNTLTLLSQTALQENADETQQLVQQLSDLLRYNLYNKRDYVSIRQELDVLHQYIHIQKSRFRNRIQFWVDCQISPDEVEIPSFTLQPLVGNSVQHGLDGKSSGGQVRVRIWEKDGFVHIMVTDNGSGIERETLSALRAGTYLPKRKDSGIGIGNVAARLKMLYHNSTFRIFSIKGIGTCISLTYPLTPIESEI